MAKTAVWTSGTGMPMADAMMRSWVVARIQIPYFPYLRKSHRAPMIAAERIAMTIRYQGNWMWKNWNWLVMGSWIFRATGPYCQRA